MKLVRQPEGSSLCGQACVATLAGVSLEEAIAAFGGTKGGTRTKQVIAALRRLGVACAEKLTRVTLDPWQDYRQMDTVIVKMHFKGSKHTHWTIWHQGRYYDPDLGVLRVYPPGAWATSFLPIYLWSKEASPE